MRRLMLPALTALIAACGGPSTETLQTDILVVGGGTSGTAAALQAARLGADVVIVEETVWLGGMLTAAGVSATDGNHMLPSGIWGEFRDSLRARYGGAEALATGWVSNTHFEPWVGADILDRMAGAEPTLQRRHGFRVVAMEKNGDRVTGARFVNADGDSLVVRALITIAADEYGDALALAGVRHRIGFEARAESGDSAAPETAFPHIQDLTYTVVLKDFGRPVDGDGLEPEAYDAAWFDGACKELASDTTAQVVNCGPDGGKPLHALNYAALPNGHILINWPIHGNDAYEPVTGMTWAEREAAFARAKDFTKAFVRHLREAGGYTNLGLPEHGFPTADGFPLIPYNRESRRIYGPVMLTVRDLQDPYADPARPWYRQAVAVGDYPLDLHHERKPDSLHVAVKTADLPKIPSYSVPYGALIPETVDGLIVAEKSINTTHIVNGSTRLQPVVLGIGQAAGAAAVAALQQGVEPRQVDVRRVQQLLLDAGAWLLPFADITPADTTFQAVQRAGVSGWIRGVGEPSAWANRTWVRPDSAVTAADLRVTASAMGVALETPGRDRPVVRYEVVDALWRFAGRPGANAASWFLETGLRPGWFDAERRISGRQTVTRKEYAWLLDRVLDPFGR